MLLRARVVPDRVIAAVTVADAEEKAAAAAVETDAPVMAAATDAVALEAAREGTDNS
jgi:hypothetical protein